MRWENILKEADWMSDYGSLSGMRQDQVLVSKLTNMAKEITNMLDIGDIIKQIDDMQDEIQKYREETSKAEGAITTSAPATADLFNISYSGKNKKKKKKKVEE